MTFSLGSEESRGHNKKLCDVAPYIRYDERASELNYTAIDLDTLRFYRLSWFGDSLTEKLDEIGYKQP